MPVFSWRYVHSSMSGGHVVLYFQLVQHLSVDLYRKAPFVRWILAAPNDQAEGGSFVFC